MLQTSSIQGVFRVDFCPVVTNVVNPRAFSPKMVVFGLRLTTFVTSAAHWSPGQAPPPPINFARNSPVVCSIIEFALLELQRFWGVSKNDHDKLRAKCGGGGVVAARGHHSQAPSARRPACLKLLSPLRAQAEPQLKPASPLRAPAEPQLKPASPLRVRNGRFWCVFRLHW